MVQVGTRCSPGYWEASFQRHFRQGAALCLALLLTSALLLAGCGSNSEESEDEDTTYTPTDIAPTLAEVTAVSTQSAQEKKSM